MSLNRPKGGYLPSFLDKFLQKFDHIGRTTGRQRASFSKHELIQRNLEIEEERLGLDHRCKNVLERGRMDELAEIEAHQDRLMGESDHIEGTLRDKFGYVGGGRFILNEAIQEARDLGSAAGQSFEIRIEPKGSSDELSDGVKVSDSEESDGSEDDQSDGDIEMEPVGKLTHETQLDEKSPESTHAFLSSGIMSSTQASSSSSMGVHEQVHVLIPRRNADISSPSAGIPCEIDRSTQFLSFMSSEPQLQSPNQNHTSSYLNVLQSQPSLSTLPMLHQPFPVLSGTIVSDIPPPPPPLPNLADLMPPNITNNPILLQSEIVPNAIATQSQSLPIYLPPINLGFPVLSPQIISTDSSSPLPQSPGPTLLGNVRGQNDDYLTDNLVDQSPNSITVPMGRDR
eukprot:263676_1